MINLLIQLIIFCVVGGLIYYLITLLPLPAPFMKVVQIAMILILVLVLLFMFMPYVHGFNGGWR